MFDGSLPEIGELAALADAAVVDAAGGWARVEAAACARKQAAMAETFSRRTGLGAEERELWWVDPEAAGSGSFRPRSHLLRQGAYNHFRAPPGAAVNQDVDVFDGAAEEFAAGASACIASSMVSGQRLAVRFR